jgi:hypothetical protein
MIKRAGGIFGLHNVRRYRAVNGVAHAVRVPLRFPGEDPIGRTLITGMVQRPSQVVGVVADMRSRVVNLANETPLGYATGGDRKRGDRREPVRCARG